MVRHYGFDFTINSGEPKSADEESKNWKIPITVTAITNKNIDFCASHCIKTLQSLSLSDEEVSNYKNLSKAIFNVAVKYNGTNYSFYLRKNTSFSALDRLFSKWEYYTRLFKVESGIDELNSDDFKNVSRSSRGCALLTAVDCAARDPTDGDDNLFLPACCTDNWSCRLLSNTYYNWFSNRTT